MIPARAGNRPPEQPENKDGWAERALAEPRCGLATLIGALADIPGVAYLSALNNLVTETSSTAAQVVAVIQIGRLHARSELSVCHFPN